MQKHWKLVVSLKFSYYFINWTPVNSLLFPLAPFKAFPLILTSLSYKESASCKSLIRDELIIRASAVGQDFPISWVLSSEKLVQEYESL